MTANAGIADRKPTIAEVRISEASGKASSNKSIVSFHSSDDVTYKKVSN
jgi:hypothetical protein